jgi:hypothetical protein
MRSLSTFLMLSTAVLATVAVAHADPQLIAAGTLTDSSAGKGTDLSGLAGKLESGVAANYLGGTGSGLAYAGNGTFLGIPDRGPNATVYNAKIDNTVSFIERVHTITMALAPAPAGSALPMTLTPTLKATTLLWSAAPLTYGTGAGLDVGPGAPKENAAGKFYFTGRSDNFDPTKDSCFSDNARFDAESIRVSADGKSVFISDEYGPYVYQFDRATGQRLKAFALPANLCIPAAVLSPVGQNEIDNAKVGRVTNKGMEGLAITPDGKTLVGVMQAALEQDAAVAAAKKLLRLVSIDVASGATKEYGYLLTDGSGVSDIVAVNDHQFLLDERDGAGLGNGDAAKVKKIYKIDLTGAADISKLDGQAAVDAAVKKTQFLDIVAALGSNGTAPDKVPSKIEGIAFGPDVTLNGQTRHTLFIGNDNDFLPETSGPNVFYVFGFSDVDLPGLVQQAVTQ